MADYWERYDPAEDEYLVHNLFAGQLGNDAIGGLQHRFGEGQRPRAKRLQSPMATHLILRTDHSRPTRPDGFVPSPRSLTL